MSTAHIAKLFLSCHAASTAVRLVLPIIVTVEILASVLSVLLGLGSRCFTTKRQYLVIFHHLQSLSQLISFAIMENCCHHLLNLNFPLLLLLACEMIHNPGRGLPHLRLGTANFHSTRDQAPSLLDPVTSNGIDHLGNNETWLTMREALADMFEKTLPPGFLLLSGNRNQSGEGEKEGLVHFISPYIYSDQSAN